MSRFKHSFYAASYLRPPLKAPRTVVQKAVKALENVKYDVIVVRGISGLLFGSMLALRTGKKLAIVRKKTETAHSSNAMEGFVGGRYLFVDDLIDTGETYSATRKAFISACRDARKKFRFVGCYLYDETDYNSQGPNYERGVYHPPAVCRKL